MERALDPGSQYVMTGGGLGMAYRSMGEISTKVNWHGRILSIQPRTRVWRYLTDNRTHYHLGYLLFISREDGDSQNKPHSIANNERDDEWDAAWDDEGHGRHEERPWFSVAISEKQLMSLRFRIGDRVKGTAWTPQYPEKEFADLYRAGSMKTLENSTLPAPPQAPPWMCFPKPLEVYEERGARLLSKSMWQTKCFPCVWANMANVEIQWDFDRDIKRYRFETFCYGPKTCKYYKMGRARSVPYKNRYTALDDGCLDDLCTDRRNEVDFEWNVRQP